MPRCSPRSMRWPSRRAPPASRSPSGWRRTADQLAEDMRERLLAEKWVAEQTRGEKPSTAEVRAWFELHRSDLDVKEEVHAQQILVATAEEAKSLLDQVRAGASFEQLARSHGRSPDAQRGGDLGWFA